MTDVFAYANGFLTARQGCRALQVCALRTDIVSKPFTIHYSPFTIHHSLFTISKS